MRELVKSPRFEAELTRAIRRGLSPDDWEHLAYLLAKYDALPDEYGEHSLTDNLQGYHDCHLAGDLVVVYKRTAKKVTLARIGKHVDVLGHRKNRGLRGWIFER